MFMLPSKNCLNFRKGLILHPDQLAFIGNQKAKCWRYFRPLHVVIFRFSNELYHNLFVWSKKCNVLPEKCFISHSGQWSCEKYSAIAAEENKIDHENNWVMHDITSLDKPYHFWQARSSDLGLIALQHCLSCS